MDEWTIKKLADVIELRRGFDLPTRERKPGPYRVLSAGMVAGWHDSGPVKGPGFVIGRATNLGMPTWCDEDFWPLNTTLYAADFKGNEPRFLYHLFQALDLSGFDSGSVQPMLNRNYISAVEVRVPDGRTQKAIAEVLLAFDRKITSNDQVRASALELARTTFGRSIRELESVPTTLGELSASGWLQIGDGYRTKRTEHGKPGLRILRAGDVQSDSLSPSGKDYVSSRFRKAIGHKASEPGDIVMTTKGTVGRVAVVPRGFEGIVYSPQLCYFRVVDREHLVPGFLSAWFRSDDLRTQAELRMFKSDMAPYINLKDIASMIVPMVSVPEQRRIGEVQSALEQVTHAATRENEALARTRGELLPLLMSGKVRVRDAEKLVEEVV